MAEGADRHWTGAIEALSGSDTARSYRGFYAHSYRYQSAISHATVLGLNRVTKDLDGGGKQVQFEERDEEEHGPVGNATLMFGLTLLVAAEAVGWPDRREVEAVFAG